ncbi:MAG: methyltransferase [Verrucomicrobia bacterium]|nr:methyltransferase [Verrucomicrobiota bacterium]
MTSRERILAAISHEPVDRVPIDLGGTRQSGVSVFAYAKLREHLARSSRREEAPIRGQGSKVRDQTGNQSLFTSAATVPRVFDLFQMLAEIEPDVASRFGSDCVALNRRAVAFGIPNESWKPWRLHDGTAVEVPGSFFPERLPSGDLVLRRNGAIIAQMPEGGFYFDRSEKYPGALHPDLASWEPPRLSAADLEHFRAEAERLHRTTDQAVIAALGPPYELFNGLGQGGFEDWMVTFASEPDYVRQLYRKLTDAWLENLEAFQATVGDRVQILQIADDFGTQNAPFLSTRAFRELVLPAYRRGLDWVHQRTPWKVMLHSDGALVPLLPSIIEMGVDILNPVQTTAAGMDPRRLKAEFGERLVFWGGSCDCQGTLTRGTPEQVVAEVCAHLDAFMPGSGYVFASVHNIQANVPPENIMALFDTALNYR